MTYATATAATVEHLEMRWLPVIDAAGRTRMEATWITVPAAAVLHVAA